jgi:hypothetical protein
MNAAVRVLGCDGGNMPVLAGALEGSQSTLALAFFSRLSFGCHNHSPQATRIQIPHRN